MNVCKILRFKANASLSQMVLKLYCTNFSLHEGTKLLLENEEMKPRQNPGRVAHKMTPVPEYAIQGLREALEGFKFKTLFEKGVVLQNYLYSRHLPLENDEMNEKYQEAYDSVMKDQRLQDIMDDGERQKKQAKIQEEFSRLAYNWKPIHYDQESCLIYAIARASHDYAALSKIFWEIYHRDKNFQPKTVCDFGSGIGTTTWAANDYWGKSIKEYLCIDPSEDMHSLAKLLFKYAEPPIRNVFQRQFFPTSPQPKYDLIVSAYTLFEIPNARSRLEVIYRLWRKTGKYLVIVEQGTNAGFEAIKQARDFILKVHETKLGKTIAPAQIFSPCPHELQCPRYTFDNTPCNFPVTTADLPMQFAATSGHEIYSYIVFQKGKRVDNHNWPRLVRPTLKRSGFAHCRMCTAKGTLEDKIFAKKKCGKAMYYVAKVSRWGDRLPVTENDSLDPAASEFIQMEESRSSDYDEDEITEEDVQRVIDQYTIKDESEK